MVQKPEIVENLRWFNAAGSMENTACITLPRQSLYSATQRHKHGHISKCPYAEQFGGGRISHYQAPSKERARCYLNR